MWPSFRSLSSSIGSGFGDELGRVNEYGGKVPSELDDSTQRAVTQIHTDRTTLLLPAFEATAVTDIDRDLGDVAVNDQ